MRVSCRKDHEAPESSAVVLHIEQGEAGQEAKTQEAKGNGRRDGRSWSVETRSKGKDHQSFDMSHSLVGIERTSVQGSNPSMHHPILFEALPDSKIFSLPSSSSGWQVLEARTGRSSPEFPLQS